MSLAIQGHPKWMGHIKKLQSMGSKRVRHDLATKQQKTHNPKNPLLGINPKHIFYYIMVIAALFMAMGNWKQSEFWVGGMVFPSISSVQFSYSVVSASL